MKFKIKTTLLLILALFTHTIYANPGALFQVQSSGTPGNVTMTLCLNGLGPLSCQKYSASSLNLIITPTITNHFYPTAGIKIEPPYLLSNTNINCLSINNGFCIFALSSAMPKYLSLVNVVQLSTSNPSNQTAYSGQTATFTVTASGGTTPYSYQWQVSTNNGTSFSNIIGATDSSYTTGALDWAANGNQYQVIVSDNAGGHVTSGAALLTVVRSPILVVGIYRNASANYVPYLAQSIDGQNWSYPQTIITNIPAGLNFLTLNAASCHENSCITVGGGGGMPVLASSANGGASWTYEIGNPGSWPNNLVEGDFATSACNSSSCVAAGYHTTSAGPFPPPPRIPLLAQSINGGPWQYQVTSTGPFPSNYQNSNSNQFISGTCNSSTCLVLGAYQTNRLTSPMILNVTNNGTLSYSLDTSSPALPSDFNGLNGNQGQISCSDNICVAAMSYSSTNGIDYPLLFTSNDSGQTWSLAIDSSSDFPNDFINQGAFETASCNGTVCTAGGSYNGSPAWIATSTNVGGSNTWSFTVYSNNPTNPSDYVSNGYVNSITCQANVCLAGGYYLTRYQTGDVYIGQILTSATNGTTWNYTMDGIGPLPANIATTNPNTDHYRLSAINCYGNASICLATGIYTAIDSNIYPAVALSLNGGQTWSYSMDFGMAASLPLDYGGNAIINNLSN
jgi:hypothetical protein